MNLVPVRSGKARICKFLLLEDETLLVGFFEEHQKLWRAHCSSIGKLEEAFGRPHLIGAGMVLVFVGARVKVFNWWSAGYRMETSVNLRPTIEACLADHSDLLFEMNKDAGNS